MSYLHFLVELNFSWGFGWEVSSKVKSFYLTLTDYNNISIKRVGARFNRAISWRRWTCSSKYVYYIMFVRFCVFHVFPLSFSLFVCKAKERKSSCLCKERKEQEYKFNFISCG